MSLPSLLTAVRDTLIAYGNANPLTGDNTAWVDNRSVSVEETEYPPPEASGFRDFYCVIHPGSWTAGDLQDTNPGLDEVFGFNVTVGKKVGTRPVTKLYEAAYTDNQALYKRIRQVISAINWNYAILTAANLTLSGKGFTEPPVWRRTESPFRISDGSWIIGASEKAVAENLLLIATIEFGNVRRTQCISDPPN